MTAFLGIGLFDAICWLILVPVFCVLGYRSLERSAARGALVAKWIISALLLILIHYITYLNVPYRPVLVLFPAGILGLMWAPSIGAFICPAADQRLRWGWTRSRGETVLLHRRSPPP